MYLLCPSGCISFSYSLLNKCFAHFNLGKEKINKFYNFKHIQHKCCLPADSDKRVLFILFFYTYFLHNFDFGVPFNLRHCVLHVIKYHINCVKYVVVCQVYSSYIIMVPGAWYYRFLTLTLSLFFLVSPHMTLYAWLQDFSARTHALLLTSGVRTRMNANFQDGGGGRREGDERN